MSTIKQIQAHLNTALMTLSGYEYKPIAKPIFCVSGARLSVQASESHYSVPRSNKGPYTHVEVGYPRGIDKIPEAWRDYAEDDEAPVSTIYAYIPIELVAQFINEQGGIAK